MHSEEEKEYERFFLKREAKSMRGKHKELSHVRPIQREDVAIILREYRLTLNVMGQESQGMNKLTHQKGLSIFLYSSKQRTTKE